MLTVKNPFGESDREEYKALFKKRFPNASSETADCMITALHDSITIYYNAVYHFSKYYIIACPESVDVLNHNRKSTFWAHAIEALYGAGVMYICGLLDEGDINHKNLRTFAKNSGMLKNSSIVLQELPHSVLDIYSRMKVLRNRRLAHYEYNREVSVQFYDDPIIACRDIRDYLIEVESTLFNTRYETPLLSDKVMREFDNVCHDVSLLSIDASAKVDTLTYLRKVEGVQ